MKAASLSWLVILALALSACDEGGGGEEADYFDQCTPGEAPDETCWVSKRDPGSDGVALAAALAARWMDEHPPEDLRWDWSEGVLMYGLTTLYRVTGDEALRAYAEAYLDHHVEEGYQISWSDSCPPGLAAADLWRDVPEQRYQAILEDIATYFRDEVPRTEHGGVSHMGTVFPDTPTLWVDSLMMVGVTLARWAEATDDPDLLAEAVEQGRIFADVLQDEETGWFTHAWGWPGDQTPGLFWGRGNGWVVAALHELLRVQIVSGEAPDPDLVAALEALSAAVADTQDEETGLWWTLPSHPGEIYRETSATALFAYGLARGWRYGVRDDAVLETVARAMGGVRSRIEEDEQGRPVVTGISGPTSVGDYDLYADVPLEDDVPFGVGVAILALVETSGMPLPK
ncbi:MAG: glycoside hydrolase family 88/105 protein [Myxococcota bacterium]